MPDLNEFIILNIGLYLLCVLVTLTLLVGTIADNAPKRPFMKQFIVLLATNIVVLLGEAGLCFFGGNIENITFLKISGLCAFSGGTLIIVLYSYCLLSFIREFTDRVYWFMGHINAAVCTVYLIMTVISLFNGMLFGFDENGCWILLPC